jgi:hypothetical protein
MLHVEHFASAGVGREGLVIEGGHFYIMTSLSSRKRADNGDVFLTAFAVRITNAPRGAFLLIIPLENGVS